jgi:hypothetical protein
MAVGAALAARLETAVLQRIVACIAASCLIGVAAASAAGPAAPRAAAAPAISAEALARATQIRGEIDARFPDCGSPRLVHRGNRIADAL